MPRCSFTYHICSSWPCFLLARLLKAARKLSPICFFHCPFLHFFFFELLYWNIKVDKHVKSGTGKVVSKWWKPCVPNCALPVQSQQFKTHLMRWTSKWRESGLLPGPSLWALEQKNTQGNQFLTAVKPRASIPAERPLVQDGSEDPKQTPSPAAPASAALPAN